MNNNRISQKTPLRYMNNKQRHGYTSAKRPLNYNTNPNHNPINNPINNHNTNHNTNHNPINNINQNLLNKIKNLTGVVLDIFSKNYVNFSPTYQEIYKIIEKDPPHYYNEDSVLRIVTTVRRYYENKMEKEMPKIEPLNQFSSNDNVIPSNTNVINDELTLDKTSIRPSNRLLDGNLNPIALPPPLDGFEVPYKPKELMSTNIDSWVSYLVIDSKDRDMDIYTTPNDFTIDLTPNAYQTNNERKGYIRRNFHNVMSVEVISCMFLDTSAEPDSSDNTNPPSYVILEIPELSRNMYGTNDTLNNGFDIFTTYNTQGGYKYYKLPLNYGLSSLIHKYESGIALNKLTFRYKLPNGDLYNFGANNNTNTNTINNILLKITHKKHVISTTFLHKENS